MDAVVLSFTYLLPPFFIINLFTSLINQEARTAMNPPCSADETKTPHSNLLLLPFASPSFNYNRTTAPFFKQQQHFLMETSNAICQVQNSISENVDKCLTMLQDFSSQNPILHKIMSFSSHIESFCQMPNRHRKNWVRLSNANFAAIIPGDSVAGLVATNGISNFLNIYNTLLVCRLVLTWFPNAPPVIVTPLSTLCDPYLNIFRGIIPPLGGTLDLSPILAFLVLNAFTSAASALPAELPSNEVSKDNPFHSKSSSQKKWMTRLAGSENNSKGSNGKI